MQKIQLYQGTADKKAANFMRTPNWERGWQ